MASITIVGEIWLNLASDPSRAWNFQYLTGLQASPQAQASQEIDADGTVNTTTTPGVPKTYAVTLVAVDAMGRQALEHDLLNVPLWFRDDRGRKDAVTYSSCTVTEHPYNDECDIAVTFNVITLSEVT